MSIFRTSSQKRLAAIVLAALVVALASPAAAIGQATDPTGDQYGPAAEQIQERVSPPVKVSDEGSPAGLSASIGPLPFTGFDVIAMVAVALVITGCGFAVRRALPSPGRNETG